MAFPLIPVLMAIPSLFKAIKTVKDISTGKKEVEIPEGVEIKEYKDRNPFKRATAVTVLVKLGLLKKVQKWGGNRDDLGTLVDFACFIYKIIAFRVKGKKK